MNSKRWSLVAAAALVTTATAAEPTIKYSVMPMFECDRGYEVKLSANNSYEKRATCSSAPPVAGKLPQGTYAKAVETLRANHFEQLKPRYANDHVACKRELTDMPKVSISFRGKTVSHDRGCVGFDGEQRVRTIEKRLEELLVNAASHK